MKVFQFVVFSEYKNDNNKWLNIGYLFSSLSQHSQLKVNANFFTYDEIDDAIEVSRNNAADIIGIPLLQANYFIAMQFISKIKEFLPNVHITVGNVFATTYPEYCMKNSLNIDSVVCGEGEYSLFALCDAIIKGESLSICKGIYYRENNKIIRTKEIERIDNLDILEYPWRDYINIRGNEYGIIGSRGCTGRCSFCINNAIWGGKLRVRSIDNILDEAKMLVEKHGCKHITFYDSTFCCNNAVYKRLTDLFNGIKKRNLKFSFSINMRTNQINYDNIDIILKLTEVGLNTIMLGFEAGNAEDLAFYKKPCSIEDHNNALSIFKEYGILSGDYIVNINVGFINFHPFSTVKNIEKNIIFLKNSGLFFDFNILATRYENYGLGEISEKIKTDKLLLSDESQPIFDPYGYRFQHKNVDKLYAVFSYIRDRMNSLHIMYLDEWIITYHRWKSNYSENEEVKKTFKEYISFCYELNDFSASLALDIISLIDEETIYELEENCDRKIYEFEKSVHILLTNSKKKYLRMLKDLRKIDELVIK